MSIHSNGNALDELLNEQPDTPADAAADPLVEDEEWLAEQGRSRRLPRLSAGLVGAILLALAFTGGVIVQKNHDQALTATAPASAFGAGFAGRGGVGGAGGGAGGASGSATGSTGSAPVVVGQVVSLNGNVLVVRNVAGKNVQVTLPAGVSITAQSIIAANKLTKGTSVVVTGTTNASGAVTASGVTAR